MVTESLVLDKPAPNMELAVGLRTYLEIVKVEAPSEASYGDTVSVNVYVRNKWTDRIFAIVTGRCDGVELSSSSHYIWPDAQRIFGFSFTMPNKSVDLWIWAWYWTEAGWSTSPDDEYGPVKIDLAQWALLDSTTIAVAITAPPPIGWQPLDSRTIGVASAAPPVVGWQLLDSTTVGVSAAAPPPVGWALLDSTTLAIAAGPLPPEYELIEHVITPWAYFYEGAAEVACIVFTLPIGTQWLATDIANRFADELAARGSTLLEGKFYKDASAVAIDRYRVEITGAVPSAGTIGWAIPWNIVFWVSIAALTAFIIYWAVNWVRSVTFHPKPLSEAVKAKWTRETLAGTITDLRPEIPPEELEGMSDQELRDLLDEIYKEEVPPAGWPWYVWLGITGVGIAGSLVAVTALRTFAPKKK